MPFWMNVGFDSDQNSDVPLQLLYQQHCSYVKIVLLRSSHSWPNQHHVWQLQQLHDCLLPMQVLTMIELQGATPGQLCSMMTRDWAFDEMSLKDVESQDRHELNGHFLSFFFVCKCNTLGKEEVNEVLGGVYSYHLGGLVNGHHNY